jgi:dTDP-4-dehydrorhamnose reductase
MRCLVTGAAGLLGSELTAFLRRQNEDVTGWDLPSHDVTDVDRIINDTHGVGPDALFHLAAWTDVDGCERDPARATSVNFQGAWAAALAAEEAGCKFIYLSTDYVFDGKSGRPYRENDAPNPVSAYGRSKLMGEQAVVRTCKKRFIVRSSWLYGKHGRNFVDTIRQKCSQQPQIQVVSDQVGSPTYARDLCRPLWELARSEAYGIYHLTNSGQCSWFQLAEEIVRLTGAQCEIVPVDTTAAGRPAPRPAFSVLENRNFKRKFGKVLRPWPDALKSYLSGNDQAPSPNDQ